MSEIVTHTFLKVLTGPIALMEAFQGFRKDVNVIDIKIDPDGDPIIGLSILTDPNFDLTIDFNGKPLKDWFVEKEYKYYLETEE